MKPKDDEIYTGKGYKSGTLYLSAREKEMIFEMIEAYFMSGSDSEQQEELMGKIRKKITR